MLEKVVMTVMRRFNRSGQLIINTPSGGRERLGNNDNGPVAEITVRDRATWCGLS